VRYAPSMSIRPVLLAALVLIPSLVAAADLRITDSKGTDVVVRDALVDYGGMLSADADKEGMRVQQGDAIVKLKWTAVDSITVTRVDTAVKPSRVELDVVLSGGKHVAATLFRQGAMKLTGRSDLGEYVIDLEKVRKIAPVR
jgi:hypothetical protein